MPGAWARAHQAGCRTGCRCRAPASESTCPAAVRASLTAAVLGPAPSLSDDPPRPVAHAQNPQALPAMLSSNCLCNKLTRWVTTAVCCQKHTKDLSMSRLRVQTVALCRIRWSRCCRGSFWGDAGWRQSMQDLQLEQLGGLAAGQLALGRKVRAELLIVAVQLLVLLVAHVHGISMRCIRRLGAFLHDCRQ